MRERRVEVLNNCHQMREQGEGTKRGIEVLGIEGLEIRRGLSEGVRAGRQN